MPYAEVPTNHQHDTHIILERNVNFNCMIKGKVIATSYKAGPRNTSAQLSNLRISRRQIPSCILRQEPVGSHHHDAPEYSAGSSTYRGLSNFGNHALPHALPASCCKSILRLVWRTETDQSSAPFTTCSRQGAGKEMLIGTAKQVRSRSLFGIIAKSDQHR